MQSARSQQQRAVCILDAATGCITAGPTECESHRLHAFFGLGGPEEPALSSRADAVLVPQLSLAVSVLELPSLQERTLLTCPLAGTLGSCAAGWTQTGLAAVLWCGIKPSLVLTVHNGADGCALNILTLEPQPNKSPEIQNLLFSISPRQAHVILCYSMAGMEQPARSSIINLADGNEHGISTMNSVISIGLDSWSPSGQHFSLDLQQHVESRSPHFLCVYALENAAPIAQFSRDKCNLQGVTWSLDATMCLVSHYSDHLAISLISLSGSHKNTVRQIRQDPVLCNALAPAGDAIVRIFRTGLVHGPIQVKGKGVFTALDDVVTERGELDGIVEWHPTLRSQGIYAAMDRKGTIYLVSITQHRLIMKWRGYTFPKACSRNVHKGPSGGWPVMLCRHQFLPRECNLKWSPDGCCLVIKVCGMLHVLSFDKSLA